MKINNFSELDDILKNTFKNIREEIKLGDNAAAKKTEPLSKELEKLKKAIEESEDGVKAALKSVDMKLDEAKREIADFRKAEKSLENDVDRKLDSKTSQITTLIDKFKNDFITAIRLIKNKSISKDVFEKRMKLTDENTKQLAGYIKDILALRETMKERLKELDSSKSMITSMSSKLTALESSAAELENTQKELQKLQKGFVMHEDLEEEKNKLNIRFKDVENETKSIRNSVTAELKEASEKLKDAGKISDMAEKIKQLESAVGEIKKQSAGAQDIKDLKESEKAQFHELKEDIRGIKRDSISREAVVEDMHKLKEQIDELKTTLKSTAADWNRKMQEESKLRSESTSFVKEISTILDDKKEKKTDDVKIKIIAEPVDDGVADEKSSSALKKAVDGIVGFFVEEDNEDVAEQKMQKIAATAAEHKESKEKEKIKTEKIKIKDIKAKEREKEKKKPKIEIIHEEQEKPENENADDATEEKGPGMLSKMKEGMVNFFFEDNNDDEDAEKHEALADRDMDATESAKIMVYKDDDELQEKIRSKDGKNGKKMRPKGDKAEKYAEKAEDKSGKGRKGGKIDDSKRYKKVEKDTFADDFGKETTYYPEDYFY